MEKKRDATALDELRRDGYVILRDLLAPAEVAAIGAALAPLLDETPVGSDEFFGTRTRRLHNLLGKTRAIDAVVAHPATVALARGLLGGHAQLSIANAIEILPGESAQTLHADDSEFPLPRPHPPLVVNTMWAISEFRADNGATRLVPGTQQTQPPIDPSAPVTVAEMPPGSVLVWDGGIFHGGGANTSEHSRIGLTINYNAAWLRQQENQYLGIPRSVVRDFPAELQELAGYRAFIGISGLVDHLEPTALLADPEALAYLEEA
jgi:ectoine hydroxylase-related dioxygenase (phytanoyl-CoA dioxygenase family)